MGKQIEIEVDISSKLLKRVAELTGINDPSAIVTLALQALIDAPKPSGAPDEKPSA